MRLVISSYLNACPPNDNERWSAQAILKKDGDDEQYFHAWASTREAAIEKVIEMAKSYREEEVEV